MEDIQVGKRLSLWEEIPDFDLYMDQVISLLNSYFSEMIVNDSDIITKNMINNYVKMKVVPAPVKKRYTRVQMAYLIVVCLLKKVFEISGIKAFLPYGDDEKLKMLYTSFVEYINKTSEHIDLTEENKELLVLRLSADAIVIRTVAEKMTVRMH